MPVSRVQAVKDNLLRSRPAYDIPGRHVGHRFGHVKRDADPAHRYGVGNPGREAFHLVNLRLGKPADDIGCVRYAEGNPAGALASQLKSGSLASLLEVRVQVPGAASMGQRGAALIRQDAHRSSQG